MRKHDILLPCLPFRETDFPDLYLMASSIFIDWVVPKVFSKTSFFTFSLNVSFLLRIYFRNSKISLRVSNTLGSFFESI